MYKIPITLALLMPFTLAQLIGGRRFDVVSGSYSTRTRADGKSRWVLMEDKHTRHPCSWMSVCECWLNQTTLQLSVDCSQRGLTRLPKLYKGLRIYDLDLSGNKLEDAPNMTTDGYDLVQHLNLSDNRIKSINGDVISNNLEVLLLKNNQITRVNKTVLNKLKSESSIKWLDLENNPLTCDCKAATLVYFRNSNIPRLMHRACANADKRVKHLMSNEMCPAKLADWFKRLQAAGEESIKELGVF